MKWEELTTPEAVLAAFEAGRLVGFNTLLNFDESGWVRVLQSDPHARLLRVGRLRALIEEPAIPEGFTAWGGGDCPEGASGRRLTVVMRNGELVTGGFGIFLWPHTGSDYDIIAYRVESEQPKPEPSKRAPDYRAILIDVAGTLRRMLDDEFSDCDHERANAVIDRINNAISAPQPSPSDADSLRFVVEMIATRARNFPDFPMGYHMGELFRAIGQEPPDAEGVMGIGEMDRTAPPRVWLQVDTNGDPSDRSDPIPRDAWGELTWCYESIGGQEVVYVREDIARRPQHPQNVEGAEALAWMHRDDPNLIISAKAKAAAVRSGGATATALEPYCIPLARHLLPQVDDVFERIAKSWDDCFYDDDLSGTSIGDRLRSDWLRLTAALNPEADND
jgi:hypothetical protein